jgi:hypothetical protein
MGATSGAGTAYHSGAPNTKGVIRIRKSNKNRQWPKEKIQKDKQRSTKHTHKTKD